MINLTTIGRQLTSFIRQRSPLSLEEICPVTLAILNFRFAAYDMAEQSEGARDDWKSLLTDMNRDNIEPKYLLQSVLLYNCDLYEDRQTMFDLYDRVARQILRLPEGDFCREYVQLIDECTTDYCARGRRESVFDYILYLHGGRNLEVLPPDVKLLMSHVIKRTIRRWENVTLFDPFCGTGYLAISVIEENATVSQAVLSDASLLQTDMTRLSMSVHGISRAIIETDDFMRDEWRPERRYDVIVSMPAWGVRRRVSGLNGRELPFDYAVINRVLESLKHNGVALLAMPFSVLTQSGIGEEVRQQLVASNWLRAVIEMPVNMLYSTSIAFALLVFQHSDRQNDVMMINANKLFMRAGRMNRMSHQDVIRVVSAYARNSEVRGLSRRVAYDEIAANSFILQPSKYVTDRDGEMRLMEEKIEKINALNAKVKALTQEHNTYLRQLGLPELDV